MNVDKEIKQKGIVKVPKNTLKELDDYFNHKRRETEYIIVFLWARCCSRAHPDACGRFIVFQITVDEYQKIIEDNTKIPVFLDFSIKEKNIGQTKREYIVFKQTNEQSARYALIFKEAGGLHEDSKWDVGDDAIFKYKDCCWSSGGNTVSNVLLAIVPDKGKVYYHWQSYKCRRGSGTIKYVVDTSTDNVLVSMGELDGLPDDFKP